MNISWTDQHGSSWRDKFKWKEAGQNNICGMTPFILCPKHDVLRKNIHIILVYITCLILYIIHTYEFQHFIKTVKKSKEL